MKDNDLFQLIISIIDGQKAIVGLNLPTNIPVLQSFQPTQEGPPTAPAIFLFKIGDNRLGFREVTDKWDQINNKMVHTETQQYETTFQISTLATQDPADIDKPTASDIANGVAYIMQSQKTVQLLEAQGVGILKIGTVRNPYFTDDRDRNEASPSFDFILTHKQVIVTEVPVVVSEVFNFQRV